jgi:hypothetical protein
MDLPVNLPVAILGVLLVVAGIVYKLGITAAEHGELRRMRQRHRDAMNEAGRPLSEREAASVTTLILFLLSPGGLMTAGVVVIFLSFKFL